jgi:type II secretory pathway component PulF
MTTTAAAAGARRRDPQRARNRQIAKGIANLRYDVGQRVSFWRELAALVEQKFDLAAALDLIRVAYSDGDTRPNEPMAALAAQWASQLRNNVPFHEVIAPIATDRERMLIQVGVASDQLQIVLEKLADFESVIMKLRARARTAFTSPAMLIVWSWGLMIANAYLFIWITNNSHTHPRGLALKMLSFSQSFWHWWSWVIPLLLIIFAAAIVYVLPRWLDPKRSRVEHRWPFNVYKAQAGCEFLLALNILVAAKQNFSPALRLMSRTASRYLQWQIDAVEPWTRKFDLSVALTRAGRQFPSARIISLIDIYARDTKAFPARLDQVAQEYVTRYEEMIQSYQDRISNIALAIGLVLQLIVTGMTAVLGLPN